jgi:DnaJ-class molecular chaperone
MTLLSCETCGGTGEIQISTRVEEGGEWGDFLEFVPCPDCGETEYEIEPACPECMGTGMELDHNGRTCACETGQRLAFTREYMADLNSRLNDAYTKGITP